MSIKVKDSNGNWIPVTGDPVPSGGDSASNEMVGMVEQNTLWTMFKLINEQGLTTEGLPDNVVYITSEDSDKYIVELGGNNPEIFA